ncbi:BID domain-containing T4SS effector [Bartonella sp. ML69XJBT]|uniref:BID domain-containing T4SS effector n=1 Tax=Bartonella sp. ML69XJBT TaxID=3019092 RepID=UPI002360FA6E|nr:BID domain-containing T4SS effector [Bartonella sp. ML69XJBT]
MLEQNYLYKNTKTLKNKYGIKNRQKLYDRVARDAAKEAVNLRYEPAPQKLDAAYLKTLHWSLFHQSFEWAGQTRDKSFTFSDGSTARMPAMRPKGHEVPFAVGGQIHKELRQLEKMLRTKDNLRGLSRQEFAANAAHVYMLLDHAHPFRKGNGRVQRMFMEKLGQVAGHHIDFSSITYERLTQASIQAMQRSNPEPMHHLFEDMTHPQKAQLLKEFISNMRNAGLGEINNRLVVAAKEGEIYNGIYRGAGAEGFVIEVGDAFVVAPKDDLAPEQVKTLQNGASICFAKSNVQNLTETLIPKETLPPLSNEEVFTRVAHDPFVEAHQKEVQRLSKLVYGNEKVLNAKMELITADPSFGQGFADQISQDPQSISKLAGVKILGMKSPERRQAQQHIPQLSEALKNYATAAQQTKEEVLEHHARQQNRLSQSVAKPSKDLQDLFALPPEQQKNALSRSPILQQQLHSFSRQLHNRLSPEDRQAIEQKDHTRLSCLLGVSESKAKEIAKTLTLTKETQCQMRSLKVSRSSSLALTG